jgi:heme A synthase
MQKTRHLDAVATASPRLLLLVVVRVLLGIIPLRRTVPVHAT